MAATQGTEAHPIPIPAGDWHVVPARSEIGFRTRAVFGLIPVRGRYSGYDGELERGLPRTVRVQAALTLERIR